MEMPWPLRAVTEPHNCSYAQLLSVCKSCYRAGRVCPDVSKQSLTQVLNASSQRQVPFVLSLIFMFFFSFSTLPPAGAKILAFLFNHWIWNKCGAIVRLIVLLLTCAVLLDCIGIQCSVHLLTCPCFVDSIFLLICCWSFLVHNSLPTGQQKYLVVLACWQCASFHAI